MDVHWEYLHRQEVQGGKIMNAISKSPTTWSEQNEVSRHQVLGNFQTLLGNVQEHL
jgi:hypothetical protein